jgi:hypothetical protein
MPEWVALLILVGAQLTRIHPNHRVWLGSLESTYYWKHSVLFRMRNMNPLAPYKLRLWSCIYQERSDCFYLLTIASHTGFAFMIIISKL